MLRERVERRLLEIEIEGGKGGKEEQEACGAGEEREKRRGEEGRVEEIRNKGIRKSKNRRRTEKRKSMIVEQCRERVVCSMVDWNRVE